MHNFKSKSLARATTLGEQLSQKRQELNLTIKDCATQLQIQSKFLTYLEESDYHKLPGQIYARRWLKDYATFLGLEPELCERRYLQEKGVKLKLIQKQTSAPSGLSQGWQWSSLLTPHALRLAGLILVIVSLLTYVGIAIFQTFEAPPVVFDQPLDSFRTQDSNVVVSGQTTPGAEVWFNDQAITVNEDGRFSQTVPLIDGLNILTIRAKKKHSREFRKTVEIVKTELPDLLDEPS